MKYLRLFLLIVVSAATGSAYADRMYVSELQYQPMYSIPDVRGELRMYLPSGTQINVLESNGRFRKVKTNEGVVGWVSAGSLIATKPYRLVAKEMTLRAQKQQEQLSAQAKKHQSEIKQMSLQIGGLKTQLNTAQTDVRSAQEKIARMAAAPPVMAAMSQPPVVASVNRESDSKAPECPEPPPVIVPPPAECPNVSPATPVETVADTASKTTPVSNVQHESASGQVSYQTVMIVGLVCLLLGLLLGWFLNDWRTRRRHGGFRI